MIHTNHKYNSFHKIRNNNSIINNSNRNMMATNEIKTKLTRQGYHIDVTTISREKLLNLEKELTMIPYMLDATKEDMEKAKFTLFKYSNNRLEIIVPRYYGVSKFGQPLEVEYDAEEIDIAFTKILRDIQTLVCERCIRYMRKNGGGLLSVPCGFGKTVCAIYVACRLGLKTLVVVHKSFLIKQWIRNLMEFLDIDISRIGIIRQNKCDVVGKDFVIGMIQTISKREYEGTFDNFGLVIYDEAHHVACKFFSKSLLKTGSQYTLALTATPYRGDGMIKVMYWFLGGTMYRERIKINKNVIVKIINYRSSDKKLFAPKKKWLKGKMRSDTGKMITNICSINSRNQKIVDIITHIRRTDPDRKILILSGRKAQLDILKEGVDALINEDIDNGLIDEDEIYSCYYVGNTKAIDRQEAEDRGDIIFATYEMAKEGLDIKHLNTVIIASPKKDVMQAIGRIMRTILKSGDIRPMVIDFADDLDAIVGWLKIRTTIYKSCKYEIENYYLVDNIFKTAYEYKGLELRDDDLHHENIYLHNAINGHHKICNTWRRDADIFNQLCNKIDIIIKRKISPIIMNNNDLLKERLILEDLEYTNIRDIFFVPKLAEKDIERQVIKKVDENTSLDLDGDIEFDNNDSMNEISIMQSLKRINKWSMPKKRLF